MANDRSIFKKLVCPSCRRWEADTTGKAKGSCCGRDMKLSDKWHVRITSNGKTVCKAISTRKQEAIEYLHAKKDAIRRKQLMPGEEENISWEVARGEFVNWTLTLSPNSVRFYDCNLRNIEAITPFSDMDLQDIEPAHLMAYRDARLKAGLSPKTVHSEMGTLNRMFTVVLESRSVRKFPLLHAAHVDLQKVKLPELNNEKERYLDAPGVDNMLASIHAPHLRLIYIIGVKTMLRKMNILSLCKQQIDFDNHCITIPRPEMKSKRKPGPHVVPIDNELETLLKEWIRDNRTFDYLFPSPTDKTKHMTNIGTGWYAAMERAGVNKGVVRAQERMTFNVATRHTGATLALEHTDDIFSVSKILDHSSVTITEKKYVKKVQRKMAEVVAAVGDKIRLVK
jgi:integrase